MAKGGVKDPETPWCTLILVFSALLCHSLVLYGNYQTSEALSSVGYSTSGWSKVGLGLSSALTSDLDAEMSVVTEELIGGLAEILKVQAVVDFSLTVFGLIADQVMRPEDAEALFLKAHAAPENVSMLLLQAAPGPSLLQEENHSAVFVPIVKEIIEGVVKTGVELIANVVDTMFVKVKPTLEKIGVLIQKFGNKIQNTVDSFGVTLDKVEKIFDQIMAQLNGHGDNEEQMIDETFLLFDVSGTGYISIQDLIDVSQLYSISALTGTKPQELVALYDEDHDGQLNGDEFRQMVRDPTVPNIMAVVLRTYARRLAEIGGQIASARMRDEVALELVHYLELVCGNNMTKVGWISDRLSNGSLPVEFTGTVLVSMCLEADNPQSMSADELGPLVVGVMYSYNPAYTVECANILSDTEWFISEGYNPLDQPGCVEMVTDWVAQAQKKESAALLSIDEAHDSQARRAAVDAKVYDAMPKVAHKLAKENLEKHTAKRREQAAQKRASLYSSSTGQLLLDRLLGGTAASSATGAGISPAELAINSGQPAVPATLRFASWLNNNASKNAEIYAGYSFTYSSESSTPIDTFSTQVQSMTGQISSFLDMMMKYSTPAGIAKIEGMIQGLTDNLPDYVTEVILTKTQPIVEQFVPAAELGLKKVAYTAGESIGYQLSEKLVEPFKEIVESGIEKVADKFQVPETSAEVYADKLGDLVGKKLANLTAPVLGEKIGNLMVDLVNTGLDKAEELIEGNADDKNEKPSLVMHEKKTVLSLQEAKNKLHNERMFLGDGGALESFTVLIQALVNLLPTAVDTLKYARTQVSKAANFMNTIFAGLEETGPAIFDSLAYYWSLLWTVYFCLLGSFTLFMLYYGLWASGFCGGPKPIASDEDYVAPEGCWARLCCLYTGCCSCLQRTHDSTICLWSCLILLQVLVLVIFIVSIVLCILAGVQAFLMAGCAQVYLLGDANICGATLEGLKGWLDTFHVVQLGEVLEEICVTENLTTCTVMSEKMSTAMILTTTFSFLATILSLQMIIETAVQHEQARFRRGILMNDKKKDEDTN